VNDYTIKAQFDADCAPEAIMRWLDHSDGIAGWWSDTVAGAAGAVGDVFHVTFPSTPVVFDLEVTAIGEDAVEWCVGENPPWWKGTTIRFDLSPVAAGGTSLLFTHSGFDVEDPVIAIVTPAWVRFLDNLIAVAVSGNPNPAVVN